MKVRSDERFLLRIVKIGKILAELERPCSIPSGYETLKIRFETFKHAIAFNKIFQSKIKRVRISL